MAGRFGREKKPVYKCKDCKWLKRISSLFDDLEVLECSKGVHDTINVVQKGGQCTRRTSPRWCPLKRQGVEQ